MSKYLADVTFKFEMEADKNYPSLQELIYLLQFINTKAWDFIMISPVNPWIDIKERKNQSMIKTLTESLELFGVPFKQLNSKQRMGLYRANHLSEDTIDELEITFEGLESGIVRGDYD